MLETTMHIIILSVVCTAIFSLFIENSLFGSYHIIYDNDDNIFKVLSEEYSVKQTIDFDNFKEAQAYVKEKNKDYHILMILDDTLSYHSNFNCEIFSCLKFFILLTLFRSVFVFTATVFVIMMVIFAMSFTFEFFLAVIGLPLYNITKTDEFKILTGKDPSK